MPTKVSPTSHIYIYITLKQSMVTKIPRIYIKEISVSNLSFFYCFFSPLFLCLTGFSKRSCSHVVQSLGLRFVWCYLKFSGLFFSFLDSSHLHDYYSCRLRVKGIRLMETYDLRSSPKSCAVSSDTFLSIRSLFGK